MDYEIGPVEYLVLAFPGNKFKGEIVPALTELVDNETIRIIDRAFIKKDVDGSVTAIELEDMGVHMTSSRLPSTGQHPMRGESR